MYMYVMYYEHQLHNHGSYAIVLVLFVAGSVILSRFHCCTKISWRTCMLLIHKCVTFLVLLCRYCRKNLMTCHRWIVLNTYGNCWHSCLMNTIIVWCSTCISGMLVLVALKHPLPVLNCWRIGLISLSWSLPVSLKTFTFLPVSWNHI